MSPNLLSLLLPIRSSRISGPPGTIIANLRSHPAISTAPSITAKSVELFLLFFRSTREIVVEGTGLLCWPLLSRRWFLKHLCGLIGFLNGQNAAGLGCGINAVPADSSSSNSPALLTLGPMPGSLIVCSSRCSCCQWPPSSSSSPWSSSCCSS